MLHLRLLADSSNWLMCKVHRCFRCFTCSTAASAQASLQSWGVQCCALVPLARCSWHVRVQGPLGRPVVVPALDPHTSCTTGAAWRSLVVNACEPVATGCCSCCAGTAMTACSCADIAGAASCCCCTAADAMAASNKGSRATPACACCCCGCECGHVGAGSCLSRSATARRTQRSPQNG